MPKVALKKNVGKHRLNDRTLVEPGQEIELSENAFKNVGDKFERVLSSEELMAMAEKKAEEEVAAAKEAEKRAEAAVKAAAAAKKSGNQGKG